MCVLCLLARKPFLIVLGKSIYKGTDAQESLNVECWNVDGKLNSFKSCHQLSLPESTQSTFSVFVKAKLLKGDWLFPLMLLEPLENYYGIKDYMSGQIRTAFNRGNEILQDANYTDISNKNLYSGVVMSNLDKYRNNFLRGSKFGGLDISADFHIYSLTWTADYFDLAIDGESIVKNLKEDFSKWMEKLHGSSKTTSEMAPFNRAFGVSAGGHSDFPDDCQNGVDRTPKPWKNGDPKAECSFWKDVDRWSRTWNSETSGLHVDYVRVFALF